jgi:steroid Delta-isomerase
MNNSAVSTEHPDMSAAVQQLVQFFETLSPQTLGSLHTLYAADARFKDPFNAVQGTAAIERIFAHMFDTLHAPRFVVTQQLVQGDQCFLVWDFHFGLRSDKGAVGRHIHGSTHVVFDASGRVLLHRDYWDAAEELYEKLPVLGSLMRWLRTKLRVPQKD